ncbi:MAG TPA: hypothetical protein VHO01_07905 [Jatrophihabitans sp.]|nr:hypothetical protein [Jatrophihabitans sp.]
MANSVVASLNRLAERYRRQGLVALAVLTALAFLASEVFQSVQNFMTSRNVIPYLTLLILLDLAAVTQTGNRESKLPQPSVNQDESLPLLIEKVRECRRNRIDLLEYAGATTLPLIREICREQVPLRVLLKHPDTVSGMQKQRMITTLDTLYNSIFEDYVGSVEIRCYRLPYSLRGRKLGNRVLELGWLTPDSRRQTAYGHANPSFLVDITRAENGYFPAFFQRSFDELWNAPDTEDAAVVLTTLQAGA